jgi:hypothetical protein
MYWLQIIVGAAIAFRVGLTALLRWAVLLLWVSKAKPFISRPRDVVWVPKRAPPEAFALTESICQGGANSIGI